MELLGAFDIPYQQISVQRSGAGLAVEMLQRTARLMRVMGEFRPDAMTGIMGPSIALAGALRRVPAVVFYDTEFAVQTNRLVFPLAYSVCTPDCYQAPVRNRRRRQYPGYHELAYLHPQPVPAGSGPAGPVRCGSERALLDRAVRVVAGRTRPARARPHGQTEAPPGGGAAHPGSGPDFV